MGIACWNRFFLPVARHPAQIQLGVNAIPMEFVIMGLSVQVALAGDGLQDSEV